MYDSFLQHYIYNIYMIFFFSLKINRPYNITFYLIYARLFLLSDKKNKKQNKK